MARADSPAKLVPVLWGMILVVSPVLAPVGCVPPDDPESSAKATGQAQDSVRDLNRQLDGLREQLDGMDASLGEVRGSFQDSAGLLESVRTSLAEESDFDELPDQLDGIGNALRDIRNRVDQFAVMAPKIWRGDDFAEKLGEFENRLDGWEKRVADPSQWPGDAAGAKELLAQYTELDQEIPTWAREVLLPRLTRVKWAVEAVTAIRSNAQVPDEEAEWLADRYHAFLDVQPTGAPQAVADQLAREIQGLDVQGAFHQVRREIEEAEAMLREEPAKPADLELARGALQTRVIWLEELQSQADADIRTRAEALAERRASLVPKLVDRYAEAEVGLLQRRLDASNALESLAFRRAGVAGVSDAALHLLLRLKVETPDAKGAIEHVHQFIADCRTQVRKVDEMQQEAYAQARRKYQKRANQQIKRLDPLCTPRNWDYDNLRAWVEKEFQAYKEPAGSTTFVPFAVFPSTKQFLQQKLRIALKGNGKLVFVEDQKQIHKTMHELPWKLTYDQLASRITREAMVKWLLPISVERLDPPLVERYREVFQVNWKKLEREDQDHVLEQDLEVEKWQLDLPE